MVEVAVRQGVLVFVEGIKEGSNLLVVDLHPDQKLLEALQVDDHVFPFFRPEVFGISRGVILLGKVDDLVQFWSSLLVTVELDSFLIAS